MEVRRAIQAECKPPLVVSNLLELGVSVGGGLCVEASQASASRLDPRLVGPLSRDPLKEGQGGFCETRVLRRGDRGQEICFVCGGPEVRERRPRGQGAGFRLSSSLKTLVEVNQAI